MSEMSDAVFARAFDAVLYEGKADLTAEIMASLQCVRHPRDLAATITMAHLSAGQVYGLPHLIRLRAEFMNKEMK